MTSLKAIKIITDPAAFELLADETRRKINHILRAKEMTVSQISHELGLTAQAIYHHIRKMKAAGLVEVSREERVGHFIETYYRSAAEIFQLMHGDESCCDYPREDHIRQAMDGLARVGLISKCEPEAVSKIIAILGRSKKAGGRTKYAEKIANLDDADILVKQTMLELAGIICESDEEAEESARQHKDLRKLLQSCVGPQKGKGKSS